MKKIYCIFLITVLFFSCDKTITEFQSRNFIKYFGSGYESKGNDVAELSDGGYVFTGYDRVNGADNQVFLTKVDVNGNPVWSNTFGRPGYNETGKIVKETSDGLIIAGTSTGISGVTHSFIMKVSIYGDSLAYNEIGNPDYKIVVNDILISNSDIFMTGLCDTANNGKTDYYAARLKSAGDNVSVDWDKIYFFDGSNNFFQNIFIQDGELLLIGSHGAVGKTSIISLQENGNPVNFEISEALDGTVADAMVIDNQIFVLTNTNTGTQLSKLNQSHTIDWETEIINSVTGKSIIYEDDGTFMICGESLEEGNPAINFIRVDAAGSAEYGQESFRTLAGSVSRGLHTQDNGLILVGSTNSTFGANVQLIKTDKDLFLLKP